MLLLKTLMPKYTSLILFLIFCIPAWAQELSCIVTINSTQITTSDRGIFRDMKTAIEQFMNSRKWSGDSYKPYEKINCNMLITITSPNPSAGNFSASVQVQAARPVYNTNYSSLIFNYADRDWEFEYIESLPLEFNDNTYTT